VITYSEKVSFLGQPIVSTFIVENP